MEDLYRDELSSVFGVLTDRLTHELKPVANYQFRKAVHLVLFEVEMQDFTRGFPVSWFALDRDNQEVKVEISKSLLDGIPRTVPADLVHTGKYVDAVIDTWGIAYELMIHWFADCWATAGGANCRVPCFIAIHDGGKFFDLKLHRVVSDEEVWGPIEDAVPPRSATLEDLDFVREQTAEPYVDRVRQAFQTHDLDAIRGLIAEGWNVNSGLYREDISALEHVSMHNHMVDIAEVLIDHGAHLGNALDVAKRRFAFDGASKDMVELLKWRYGRE